jgi:hypothetical protein
MSSIALFAIIGATIEAGTAYWIYFIAFCVVKLTETLAKVAEKYKEDSE